MPKKYTKKGGGLWDSFGTTFGNFKNSITSGASNLWNKTKKATSMNSQASNNYDTSSSYNAQASTTLPPQTSSYNSPTPSYSVPSNSYDYSTNSYTPTNGGSKRKYRNSRKRYYKRGGYNSNTSLNNLASTASPISNIQTAKAHHWVGGKSKRTRKSKNKKQRMSRHH